MIVSGGENIYPAEVENVLMRHPAVADVAVIGVPDEQVGRGRQGLRRAEPGQATERPTSSPSCASASPHFKCPTSVDFIDAIPRNPTGKILKRVLREPYWRGHERRIN